MASSPLAATRTVSPTMLADPVVISTQDEREIEIMK